MTNAAIKPEYLGQLVVFASPHHADVLLVDKAVLNLYGALTWHAVPHDNPDYIKAIKDFKSQTH